ncbi:magnesium/cobalt transporter CorA, partial [Myxococcota bacterium]|nr:magnesium/cobalt transporter CorA [Myxococcota bacterium]
LALEDALTNYQRPKMEEFDDNSHIVIRMPNTLDGLYFEQVSLIWGKNFIISIQEREGDCLDGLRQRIRTGVGRIRKSGVDYLVYAIIDAIMESYVPLIISLGEQLEVIEEGILAGHNRRSMELPHRIRKELHYMRRICIPTRELLVPLYREESRLVQAATRPYFRDCADHVMQIIEMVEVEKEFCTQIIDLHAMGLNQRMNEIMKMLTLISTIFIPLSFVAGLYGMNFATDKSPFNMPELKWYFGYPMVLSLMLGITLTLLVFFWKKGWIGDNRPDDK